MLGVLKEKAYLCNPKTEDSLAQLVEHNTFNVGVSGSSPERVTTRLSFFRKYCFLSSVGRAPDS